MVGENLELFGIAKESIAAESEQPAEFFDRRGIAVLDFSNQRFEPCDTMLGGKSADARAQRFITSTAGRCARSFSEQRRDTCKIDSGGFDRGGLLREQ